MEAPVADLFKKKLKGVPFGEHMAGYRGDGSFASASQYYRDLYQTAFDSVCAELHIKSRPLKYDRGRCGHVVRAETMTGSTTRRQSIRIISSWCSIALNRTSCSSS